MNNVKNRGMHAPVDTGDLHRASIADDMHEIVDRRSCRIPCSDLCNCHSPRYTGLYGCRTRPRCQDYHLCTCASLGVYQDHLEALIAGGRASGSSPGFRPAQRPCSLHGTAVSLHRLTYLKIY